MYEDNPVKRQARRCVLAKPEYRQAELKYLRYIMMDLSQETLKECLKTLNLRELKMAIGAGVPGEAMRFANELLQKKKRRMELFIEQDGKTATSEVEIEFPPEGEKDGKGEVCTSEGEREKDS